MCFTFLLFYFSHSRFLFPTIAICIWGFSTRWSISLLTWSCACFWLTPVISWLFSRRNRFLGCRPISLCTWVGTGSRFSSIIIVGTSSLTRLPPLSFVRRSSVTPYSCIFITNNRIARIKIFSFTTIYVEPKTNRRFMNKVQFVYFMCGKDYSSFTSIKSVTKSDLLENVKNVVVSFREIRSK